MIQKDQNTRDHSARESHARDVSANLLKAITNLRRLLMIGEYPTQYTSRMGTARVKQE